MLANRQAPVSCAWLRSRRARKSAALLPRLARRAVRKVSGRGASRQDRRLRRLRRASNKGLWSSGVVDMRVSPHVHIRCRRSPSSRLVLANGADSCSDYLPMGQGLCSHYLPLCSPSSGRARQRRFVLTIAANERGLPGSYGDACDAQLLGELAGAVAGERAGKEVAHFGPEGPSVRKRTLRNDDSDNFPTILPRSAPISLIPF